MSDNIDRLSSVKPQRLSRDSVAPISNVSQHFSLVSAAFLIDRAISTPYTH